MNKSEILSKMRVIKQKLEELRQYKIVMAEEGVAPDTEDKVRESELIVRLLRLEKILAEKEGRPVTKKAPGRGPRAADRRSRAAGGKSSDKSTDKSAGKATDKSAGKSSARSGGGKPRAGKSPSKPGGAKPTSRKS